MDELYTNEVSYYKKLYEKEKMLNENLLRISRERANAKRNLKPKKQHAGYIVLSSREIIWRDNWGHTSPAWQTEIQSPYPAGIKADALRNRINTDLKTIIPMLGIVNDPIQTALRDDFRSGLWSVILTTEESIQVPVEMLPQSTRHN